MAAAQTAILSKRIVLPTRLFDGAVIVRGSKIEAIVPRAEVPRDAQVIDVEDRALMPGVVDTHAHINEPGRTEWEGFETATQAAAAGGITTVIDMPLNSIPATTSVEALETKARSAKDHCWIDYGFWGGLVPGNSSELEPMIRAGVIGFKSFLIDSGVPEFEYVDDADLREGMPILAKSKVPLIVHAEVESEAPGEAANGDVRKYRTYLASRPRVWEDDAIRMMIALCRETGCQTHIVHLSSSDALLEIARAKKAGLPFSVETCPHYLTFTAEEIFEGATHFKCAPPIREKDNREQLWLGIKEGLIDCVVSDHSPCTPRLKLMDLGDFDRAWGGISSIQFSLPAVWTQMRQRGMDLTDLARLMCANTAKLAGLDRSKGEIAPGMDADLVVFDPDAPLKVEPAMVRHRHRVTPYTGQNLRGAVQTVFLRGKKIYENGRFEGGPSGERLSRSRKG